jgi:hypothetical protein
VDFDSGGDARGYVWEYNRLTLLGGLGGRQAGAITRTAGRSAKVRDRRRHGGRLYTDRGLEAGDEDWARAQHAGADGMIQ